METNEAIAYQNDVNEALAPGDKLLLGQYEIIRYLNSGGFGITYLAKDSLNRTVVIKECFPESVCSRYNKTVRARSESHTDDYRAIVQLFIKEAHALSRLEHPSVVGVHQVFEDNDTAYMALDFVRGKDWLDVIEAGAPAITPGKLVDMTIKLLDAITHVHAQDLLHRDISPDNILIDETGHPVLIDFGAAREEASRKSRMLSSVLVVKDGYSPPEFYVKGSQQGPSSDLYALAATLSHVITGEVPPESQVRLAAVAAKQPDPHQPLAGRFPEYESQFLAAIDKAMEIIPSRRIQSAEEWSLMIDQSKRTELARVEAQSDTAIDAKVVQLVEWSKREAQHATDKKTKANVAAKQEPAAARSAKENHSPVGKNGTASSRTQVVDLRPQKTGQTARPAKGKPASRAAEKSSRRPTLTPYERVKATAIKRAVEEANAQNEPAPKPKDPRRYVRLASIPVVFCSYLFYAHSAFQQDAVRAATIQPLIALSTSISEEIENLRAPSQRERSTVLINRGLQG